LAERGENSLDPHDYPLPGKDRSLLRPQIETPETIPRAATLELDLVDRAARRVGRAIELLPREYDLLKYMMQHSGQLLRAVRSC
jgi:two-component system, OmpR family, response regulator